MVTLLWIVIIVAFVLYYRERKRDHASQTTSNPQTPNSQTSTEGAKPQTETKSQLPPNVVWKDSSRLLSFEPDGLTLSYHGKVYRFSEDGHEPMTIILHNGEAVAYIHNGFDVEYECRQFLKKPNYLCTSITGKRRDAKNFCWLLTTAIDNGYDWHIDDLECQVDELTRFESREIWYREGGIEFGRYGEEPGGREPYHYEHEILYIIVDGLKYHLYDNVNEANALYLLRPNSYGRKHASLRIHGTNRAVLAAYADDWKAGHTFTPFGYPSDTKTFCHMLAYALRSGKKDFNLPELEKAFSENSK